MSHQVRWNGEQSSEFFSISDEYQTVVYIIKPITAAKNNKRNVWKSAQTRNEVQFVYLASSWSENAGNLLVIALTIGT